MQTLSTVLSSLRGGEMALEDNVTLGTLNKTLEVVWPNDPIEQHLSGRFYQTNPMNRNCWVHTPSNPCPSSITVTEFLRLWEEEGKQSSEPVEVRCEIKPFLLRYDLNTNGRNGFFRLVYAESFDQAKKKLMKEERVIDAYIIESSIVNLTIE